MNVFSYTFGTTHAGLHKTSCITAAEVSSAKAGFCPDCSVVFVCLFSLNLTVE